MLFTLFKNNILQNFAKFPCVSTIAVQGFFNIKGTIVSKN